MRRASRHAAHSSGSRHSSASGSGTILASVETTETYGKHAIDVAVTKVREHAWTWAYAIDAKVFSGSPRSRVLPDAETAMRQGLGAARARVDEVMGGAH